MALLMGGPVNLHKLLYTLEVQSRAAVHAT